MSETRPEPTLPPAETPAEEVPAEAPENRTNASLERENTALGLESDELKAQQVTMEAQQVTMEAHQVTMQAHQVSLERLVDINRALLDASVDGIRLVDLEGRSLLANSVIEHLTSVIFGLPRYSTLQEGRAIADRLTDPASYIDTMDTIAADPHCATQDDFELADVRRAFQRHTGPVRDSAGELIGRIIVVREITAEREAARLKSELVATVSHELRTPLTGVLGFAELLMHHGLDEATQARYLQTIHSEAQRLTSLVDDFLDVQKIEAGRFTLALESFELGELLEHQVELFSAHSANHKLDFAAVDEPLAMVGDRNRIGQVISNLLSNAIKYSPAGGTVTITATPREGFARVQVSDSGLGIPASQQAQVFTRFFRVDSSDTREIGGTGLGLALCHEIVTAHGGRIGFESREGVGSTFWFELPSAWRASAADNRARVLVIEDDAALSTLLAECLALDGLEVELAATGETGPRAGVRPPAGGDLPRRLPPGCARRLAGARAAQVQPADRAHARDRVHGREGPQHRQHARRHRVRGQALHGRSAARGRGPPARGGALLGARRRRRHRPAPPRDRDARARRRRAARGRGRPRGARNDRRAPAGRARAGSRDAQARRLRRPRAAARAAPRRASCPSSCSPGAS